MSAGPWYASGAARMAQAVRTGKVSAAELVRTCLARIEATDGPLVMCRRIGALYLGLALMFLLGRTAAPSDLRSAVCLGVGGASALLALLGFFELWAGRVSSGVIVPALVEVVLAAAFVWVWWGGRCSSE